MIRAALLALLLATPLHAGEAEDRKAASIALLQEQGVPVLPTLPTIETEAQSLRRTEEEVIRRTIALAIVAVKGETGDSDLARNLITQFEADESWFSPAEQAFLDTADPDQQMRAQFAWRYETVEVMLWALGIYDELKYPSEIMDVPRMADTLRGLGTEGLRAQASLRPQAELLDAADRIYRYHWATRQARLDGAPPPAGLYPDVIWERHHALNWLIGAHGGQRWDEVSTDT
ncbi:DUF4272 domain-containing protein [Vannielia litorea]|uniref:DUF4272 domain-containing protein n=1 Tax=Vannielia litorea TaxID=1217970 RepID=UPI001C94CEB0|nr:DUF4272 domain-containing protein [Vannielia litorea]MBY6046199.1 DUF4272 domain-containing protein [Vannielia litorea]MBY6073612.1 DUF4272 domain-containing protein [Vannielia litorea]